MNSEPFARWLDKWQLSPDGEPFTTPHTASRLLPVLQDGERAILKIAGHAEERRGGELMEWYGGIGAAPVLARDGDAILLVLLCGDRSLAEMARSGDDDEATRILCGTACALHAPRGKEPPANLVPLETWCRALEPAAAAHGDLHHDNVLDGEERGWLAIDPKGVFGERAFDYANLFRNPDVETALTPGRMARRVKIVAAESGLEPTRILEWVLAYAGLGAAWSLESGQDPKPGLRIAESAAAELEK